MNVIRLPQILADEPDLTEVVLQALSQAANKPQHPYDHKHSANNNATATVWEPEELDELAISEESGVEDGSNDDAALQIASLRFLPTPCMI